MRRRRKNIINVKTINVNIHVNVGRKEENVNGDGNGLDKLERWLLLAVEIITLILLIL